MSVDSELPDGWSKIRVGSDTLYICEDMVATAKCPSKKGAQVRRNSLITKEAGTYSLDPQCVAVNPDGNGVYVYQNTDDSLIQFADPRPKVKDENGPLPDGWECAKDEDGDMYFIDHNSGITTYKDPRLQFEGDSGPVLIPAQPGLIISDDGAEEAAWRIAGVDHTGFNDLGQYLTPASKLPECVANKKFNRYLNILPNPSRGKTRVRLDKIGDDPTTEYYNANYCPSYNGTPREFIAAMGPTENTIPAFWRMIWQTKSTSIVMATSLMEHGVLKCARYWPTVRFNETKNIGDKQYGDIKVAVMFGERRPGYIRTYLRLQRDGEEHLVSHFWYNEWPDHGVPKTSKNVLKLLEEVRNHNRVSKGGPTVVHCSAGIGRTGTLIAIEHGMKLLMKEQMLDALKVIKILRECRGGMVQHPQQYEFVIKACAEFSRLQNKKFAILPVNVTSQAVTKAQSGVPESFVHPSQVKADEASDDKVPEWRQLIKEKKIQELETLVRGKQPADMPDAAWRKLQRQWEKHQAKAMAQRSIRRRLSDAELHGELRLGTIKREAKKSRGSVANLF